MLRKAIHIILSSLLLFATFGFTISKHYCRGNHVSTSIFGKAKSCCDDGDCCKNESELFQLDKDYALVSVSGIPPNTEFELLGFTILVHNCTVIETTEIQEFFESDLPPPLKIQTILSQNQTYLL